MTGILVITILAFALGVSLGMANRWFVSNDNSLVEQINHLLPQTQCAQCGYPGCKPYAEAIANESVPINQCPPGGDTTVTALAELLNREVIPLNPEFGAHTAPMIAKIRERECIGCTLCIKACPVDAIVGAAKLMHTVLNDHCTGCELCIPPCPIDCIDLIADDNPL